jgi:hypothetical protein
MLIWDIWLKEKAEAPVCKIRCFSEQVEELINGERGVADQSAKCAD